ncbi:hypothetical protein Tco_1104675 [Tanacetum coccineum]
MNNLRAIQSQLKFLIETLQDFGNMHIFKRTFSQDLDLLENHLTKEIISQTDCKTTLTKLRTTFENTFNSELKARIQNYTRYDAQSFYDAMIFNMDSLGKYTLELILHQQRTPQLLKQKKLMQTQEDQSNPIPALNVDSLKVNLAIIQNTCSEKEDSNSEIASSKLVKECSLNSETKDVHAIKYKMSKAKERCMAYFRSLHSHLQVLSKDDLKGTRIEHGFKRAFMSIFGQDVDTFTRTMLLNVDQLQKQLDKDEFQEDGSMTAFWVVNNQFQKFINSKFTLDYDSQMTDTYFVEYTGLEVQHFRDTLLQHLGNVKKSVAERTRHQRQYERRVNKRQMQTQESKIDTGKALDADLVDTESIRTDSTVQDDSSRSGNDTDADDADIRPIYDEEPMAEVQLTAECNIFAIGQQHTEQPKPKSLMKAYKDLYDSIKITRSKTTEQTTSLLANNAELKAQIQEKISLTNMNAHKLLMSVSTSKLSQEQSFNPKKEELRVWPQTSMSNDVCSQQFRPRSSMSNDKSIKPAENSKHRQKSWRYVLFGPLFDEYFNGENQVVLKSSAVTTTDASNKRQQPDSTSSTSTLATTVTANGNFDL